MWRARRSPSTFGFLASTYFLERDSINMRGNIANTCHITGPFQAPSPKQTTFEKSVPRQAPLLATPFAKPLQCGRP